MSSFLGKAAKAYREVEHTKLDALKVDPGLDPITTDPVSVGPIWWPRSSAR
ncbi:hypothetical protein [Amycolatopsis speibonae]|uniref:Uncharacterized protein n=1 Tax=Amycolatopsis speibonae TaxID=1450224 RepID=A0ABV7PB49_9PSEU